MDLPEENQEPCQNVNCHSITTVPEFELSQSDNIDYDSLHEIKNVKEPGID